MKKCEQSIQYDTHDCQPRPVFLANQTQHPKRSAYPRWQNQPHFFGMCKSDHFAWPDRVGLAHALYCMMLPSILVCRIFSVACGFGRVEVLILLVHLAPYEQRIAGFDSLRPDGF
jgi:hypothetical protein